MSLLLEKVKCNLAVLIVGQALKVFCNTLQSLGDLWTTEKWMVRCRYDSSMKLQHSELEHICMLYVGLK